MFGIIGFVFSTLALVVISATMFARANDQRFKRGLRWNTRLLGFVLAMCAPIGIIWVELATADWPSFFSVMFRIGVAFVFVTTPGQPPWHRFMTKGENA